MRSIATDRPIASFVTVTFAFSWIAWVIGFAAFESPALGFASVVAGGFGPLVGAATVLGLSGHSVRGWLRDGLTVRIAPRWYALAVAIPLFFALVQTAFLVATGARTDPGLLPGRLSAFVGALAFTFFLGGGQEEFGWRGFMLPRLRDRYGSAGASLVVGVVWALWHFPLYAIPGALYADRPFVTYVPVVVALAVVFTWFDNRTRGAIPALMLLHAAVNNAGTLIPVAPAELAGYGSDSTYYLVQFAAALAVVAAILVADGRSLGQDGERRRVANAARTDDPGTASDL